MLRGRYRLSRPAVFALLMTASLAAMFFPRRLTDPLKHVVQLVAPAQDFAFSAAQLAARGAARLDQADPDAADATTQRLQQALAAQAALIDQLQAENDRLRAVRRDHLDDAVPLLAAHVVSLDAAIWRDSVLVSRGSFGGVAYQDWVTSRLFADRGLAFGVERDQPVLAAQGLIGRVEQVSPYLCRVQLLTDVDAPRVEVRVVRVRDGQAAMIDYPCSIKGAGRGHMTIEGIDYRWIEGAATAESGDSPRPAIAIRMAIDDLVFTAPGQLGLPRPIVIGRIVRLEENPRRRLVYNAVVEPLVPIEDVREVYIIPLTPTASIRVPQ